MNNLTIGSEKVRCPYCSKSVEVPVNCSKKVSMEYMTCENAECQKSFVVKITRLYDIKTSVLKFEDEKKGGVGEI